MERPVTPAGNLFQCSMATLTHLHVLQGNIWRDLLAALLIKPRPIPKPPPQPLASFCSTGYTHTTFPYHTNLLLNVLIVVMSGVASAVTDGASPTLPGPLGKPM